MKTKALLFSLLISVTCNGQTTDQSRLNRYLDFTAAAGKSQITGALSYVHNWKLGKNKRIEAGLGLRLTNATSRNLDYTTAGPARLTRSFTTPFLIFFAGQKTENWDTLSLNKSSINSLNVTINLGYNFTQKLNAGFNIDLIGVSFGKKYTSGTFYSNGKSNASFTARPTLFNLLLTGDHDLGTLNSEFFLAYKLNKSWSVKGLYQFIFTEYETKGVTQTASDGTLINRFRNKANNLGLGIIHHF